MELAGWKEVGQTDAQLDTLTYNLMDDLSWGEHAPAQELWSIDLKSDKASMTFASAHPRASFLWGSAVRVVASRGRSCLAVPNKADNTGALPRLHTARVARKSPVNFACAVIKYTR
jgi:hypothetical protein